MHTKRPKRKWLASFVVNQKNFWIQDHTLPTRESLRDEVLKMGHLGEKDRKIQLLAEERDSPQCRWFSQKHVWGTCRHICASFAFYYGMHCTVYKEKNDSRTNITKSPSWYQASWNAVCKEDSKAESLMLVSSSGCPPKLTGYNSIKCCFSRFHVST